MPNVWIPPKVSRAMLEDRERERAEVAQQFLAIDHWTKKLQEIDPYLECGWVPENATALGLTPGRFHVLRHDPGAPVMAEPHETPEGEFRDLDSSILDTLIKGDMWSNRSLKEKRRLERKAERSAERAKEEERRLLNEELTERIGSLNRLQVRF